MNDLKGIIEDCNKGDLVSDKIIKKIIEIIGQEKWQDLHDENNDICTTMGELIITLEGIADLEQKLEQTEKDLADYQFNYPTIKELETEVKEWKDKADLWCKTANLKDHNIMINKELEKENADLKEEINKIAFARGNLEEENAELKESNKMLEQGYVWHDYDAGEDCYEDSHEGKWVKRDEVYQLTKAKEIIKKLYSHVFQGMGFMELNDYNVQKAEAEQFLNSEVEK